MATIQFENGKKVTFEGTPSPKDIEEVSRTINTEQPTQATPQPSLQPKPKVGKLTSAVGGAAEGLGAKLPLMAIDYLGKKMVDRMPEDGSFMGVPKAQLQKNLANSKTTSQQYDDTFGKDQNPTTYKLGEVAGTVGGLAVPVKQGISAYKALPTVAKKTAEKKASTLEDLAGQVVQGDKADRPRALNVFSNLDTSGVKTYDDLVKVQNDAITQRAGTLDKALETNTKAVKLKDLSHKVKVGDKDVAYNYVEDSIGQLEKLYLKTNNIEEYAKIRQLKAKASKEGLTVKEINDLARQHGRDLNAFNANGEAASGLTKQAAENTRVGLKDTAKGLFKNPIYDDADKSLSNMIRTRQLTQELAEKVTELQQKIQQRGTGEKVGRLISQVINTIGMNTPKGAIEYFLGRGTGLKTLNALDLEKNLAKNLKKLKELTEGSEDDVARKLEEFLAKNKK